MVTNQKRKIIIFHGHGFSAFDPTTRTFCVKNVYNRDYVVKDEEWNRRSLKEQNITNVSIKADDKFQFQFQKDPAKLKE